MATAQRLGRDLNVKVEIEKYELCGEVQDSGSSVGRGLDVLRSRVTLLGQNSQHVEYTIRVSSEGGHNSWTLRKRFSEVAALHAILKKRLPSVPELPSKTAVRQFSLEHLEARKVALVHYFGELYRRRDVMNCPETQLFFGLERLVAAMDAGGNCEPLQVAEVQEASFGVRNFAYASANGFLLVGASDWSWASRIDTRITNIKLPWEPTAPNLPTSQMSLWRQAPGDLRFEMLFMSRYTEAITALVLSSGPEGEFCFCGLSDGTVGYRAAADPGGGGGSIMRGNVLPLLRHTASVTALAFSEQERFLFSASKDCSLVVYDFRKQMLNCEVQCPAAATCLLFREEQQRLFAGLSSGRVVLWDTARMPPKILATIPDNTEVPTGARVHCLDYDPPSETLFIGNKDSIGVWTVKASSSLVWGRSVGLIRNISSPPSCMQWAASSRELLCGFANGTVVVFDVAKGDAGFVFQAHAEEVSQLQWLDAPRRLVSSSRDKTLKVWDFPSTRTSSLDTRGLASSAAVARPVETFPAVKSDTVDPARGSSDSKGARRPAAGPFDRADPLGRPAPVLGDGAGCAAAAPSSCGSISSRRVGRLRCCGPISS